MQEPEDVGPVEEVSEDVASVEEIPEDVLLADQPPKGRDIGMLVAIVVAVLVIFAIVLGAIYGLVTHPPLTEVLRDISIIVLALVSMITLVFLAILLFQLQGLITLLRDEIQPILESVNDTAGTVRGTTTFVSDAVVSPMIRAASYVAGIRTTFNSLTGLRGPQRKGKSQDDGRPQ
jgi:hypothetical protein